MKSAFTLIELLVAMAIIAILAALLFPVLSGAKKRADRISCMNNLREVDTSVLMYAHDNADALPPSPIPHSSYPNGVIFFYKELVKGYAGLSGQPGPDKLFLCPSQKPSPNGELPSGAYLQDDYSDYFFNDYQAGIKLTSIKRPSLTVLVAEYCACVGYSWHQPQSSYFLVNSFPSSPPALHAAYNNAMNEISFADGHVNYVKVYNDGLTVSYYYNPIPGYDYQWSGK